MPSRTQIVCMHEGSKDSIDPVFIMRVLKDLAPSWIRPSTGSNGILPRGYGGRDQLIASMPAELKVCLKRGSDTTLMVWADLNHNMPDGDALKREFWEAAHKAGIQPEEFDSVVFVFAKDRIENWVEFLNTGKTDERREGPRVEGKDAADAARKLARMCVENKPVDLPVSLQWSCRNWRKLVARMNR